MSEILEKVIATSSIGTAPSGGGLLSPVQANRFISYMWDATVLGSQVRTERLRGNEMELDRMAVGERVVRLATEAVDDSMNVGVAFAKVSLSTQKLRLDWELSSEALEDNIEGEAFEDHVARLLAAQAANDIEDLAINGDVNNTDDPLFKSFDGWRKRLYAGANVVDAAGANLDREVFHRALRAMPRRYMNRRGALKWFTNAGLLQDYVYTAAFIEGSGPTDRPRGDNFVRTDAEVNQALTNGGIADSAAGWSPAAPFGIRAQEVPLFPEYDVDGTTGGTAANGGDVWLVDPKNLIWGVKREIQIYRVFQPKKDTIEYTMFTRVGAAVENPNAAVLVKNVKYRD